MLRRETGDFFHGPDGTVFEDDGRTLYEVAADGIRHPRFGHSEDLTVKWIGENLVVALDGYIAIGLDLTGRELWRTNVERPSNLPNVDSYMVGPVIGSTGNAIAYDVGANRITWSHQLGARSASNCVTRIAHGNLWLIDLTGKLHVFEIAK